MQCQLFVHGRISVHLIDQLVTSGYPLDVFGSILCGRSSWHVFPLLLPLALVSWVVPPMWCTISVSCWLAMYASVARSWLDIFNKTFIMHFGTSHMGTLVALLGLRAQAHGSHLLGGPPRPLLWGHWSHDPHLFTATSSSFCKHSRGVEKGSHQPLSCKFED